MKINKSIITILILATMLPTDSLAAVVNPSNGGDLYYNIEPKNPGSLTNVKITAISYDLELADAKISWYLNDKLEKEGLGIGSFVFKTDKPGKVSKVKTVVTTNTQRVEKTMSLNPADIDLVWEANTYVPPLYKGKALPSPKSDVKIVAIPQFISENGKTIPSNDLIYEWKDGLNPLPSGLSKNNAEILMGSPFGSKDIRVTVYNKEKTIFAEKTINIEPEKPLILFYEDKPIEGTNYKNSLQGTTEFGEKEITIRAEPYFFSYPSFLGEQNLMFNWRMNGNSANPNEGTPKIITLRNESGSEIISGISLDIDNTKKDSQRAANSLTIKSSSFFKF